MAAAARVARNAPEHHVSRQARCVVPLTAWEHLALQTLTAHVALLPLLLRRAPRAEPRVRREGAEVGEVLSASDARLASLTASMELTL